MSDLPADLTEKLRTLAEATRTVKPYKAGDTVGRYCGKAGRKVVATVNPLNWNTPEKLAVYCPTRGCSSCPMDVKRLPVRYEHQWPPTWNDVRALLDALAAAVADRDAAVERLDRMPLTRAPRVPCRPGGRAHRPLHILANGAYDADGVEHPGKECRTCWEDWPCRTRLLLDGPRVDGGES